MRSSAIPEARGCSDQVHPSAVLNVNRGVSQPEINERYRALSLLFHPDKQQNPERKEAAEEEYFKVQKAYQGVPVSPRLLFMPLTVSSPSQFFRIPS